MGLCNKLFLFFPRLLDRRREEADQSEMINTQTRNSQLLRLATIHRFAVHLTIKLFVIYTHLLFFP